MQFRIFVLGKYESLEYIGSILFYSILRVPLMQIKGKRLMLKGSNLV